jgi:polyhydroxybutyrate depolymerase
VSRWRALLRGLSPLVSVALVLAVTSCTARPASSGSGARGPRTARPDNLAHLRVDGEDRSYLLRRPERFPGPRPTVIFLHGSKDSAADIEARLAFDAVAGQSGIVAVYPNGDPTFHSWRAQCCSPGVDLPNDVDFIARLIQTLVSQGVSDAAHVVIAGFSAGAIMSYDIGCKLAAQVSGVVAVAGTMLLVPRTVRPAVAGPDFTAASVCSPARPLTVVAIHGERDQNLPFSGDASCPGTPCGPGVSSWQAPARTVSKWWQDLDHCVGAPIVSRLSNYARETRLCAGGVIVSLTLVHGAGHDLIALRQKSPLLADLVAVATGRPLTK